MIPVSSRTFLTLSSKITRGLAEYMNQKTITNFTDVHGYLLIKQNGLCVGENVSFQWTHDISSQGHITVDNCLTFEMLTEMAKLSPLVML